MAVSKQNLMSVFNDHIVASHGVICHLNYALASDSNYYMVYMYQAGSHVANMWQQSKPER